MSPSTVVSQTNNVALKKPSVRMGWLLGLVMLTVGVLQSGCAARSVLRDPDYGIVAIPYNTNRWPTRFRDQAHKIMHEHFPQGYEVLREEEFVVGHATHYEDERVGGQVNLIGDFLSIGTSTGQGRATTTPQTEYRLHYRRLDTPAPGGRY
jgi:hypothetical protein